MMHTIQLTNGVETRVYHVFDFPLYPLHRYFRVISDRTHNWLFGYHSGNMNKWYFNGWVADVNNGKDTKFHLHVASMSNSDRGNAFFDGTRVGNVNSNAADNNNYLPRSLQFGGY